MEVVPRGDLREDELVVEHGVVVVEAVGPVRGTGLGQLRVEVAVWAWPFRSAALAPVLASLLACPLIAVLTARMRE